MGLCSDVTLYVDSSDEDNPRVSNATPLQPPSDLFSFKLSCLNNVATLLGNITSLEISKCNISEIPSSIQNFHLKQLILSHNKFTEVPSCLYSGLESLELLDLSYNSLTDFHIEPACSCRIIILNLCYNKIRDFPHWILTIRSPNLQEINYSGNFLIKLKTERNFNFIKLIFRNSQLIDEHFMFLKRLKTLEFLDISNDKSGNNDNRFRDLNKLFERRKWRNLQILKLNNLTLSIIPKDIFFITSLSELHLINCDLNWIPEEIKFLENLQVLIVCENSICFVPKELYLLQKLSIFRASFNSITKVEEFTNQLEILDLFKNELEICNCDLKQIKFVDLENNFLDTRNLSEDYIKKRDQYRDYFNLNRTNGMIEKPQSPEFSDSKSTTSSEDNNEQDFYAYYTNYEEESWDYKDSNNLNKTKKNPEITSSDDEWDGKEDISKQKQLKKIEFDLDEDWIFTDAEE